MSAISQSSTVNSILYTRELARRLNLANCLGTVINPILDTTTKLRQTL